MDKNLKKLAEPGVRLHLVILVIFAAASLYRYIETAWGVGYKWNG